MKKFVVILLMLAIVISTTSCIKKEFKKGEAVLAPWAGYYWKASIDSVSLFGDDVKFTYNDGTKGNCKISELKKWIPLTGVSEQAVIYAPWGNAGGYDEAKVLKFTAKNKVVVKYTKRKQRKEFKISDLIMH